MSTEQQEAIDTEEERQALYEHIASEHRNIDINETIKGKASMGDKAADAIATFSGSIAFLLLNATAFVVWIVVNTLAPKTMRIDPYPFQFLTMAVSLEAIFLSIFVLVSQNRQAAKDRIMAENNYLTDVESKQAIMGVIEHLTAQDSELVRQTKLLTQQARILTEMIEKQKRRSKRTAEVQE
jgi:uncharacterized membrane protein